MQFLIKKIEIISPIFVVLKKTIYFTKSKIYDYEIFKNC